MTSDRRRLMMACFAAGGGAAGWQEYPAECWGYGNMNSSGAYTNYQNLYYGEFPVLSKQMKVENATNYTFSIRTFTASMQHIGSLSPVDGIYTFPDNAAYFRAILYDKPPLSVVDSGQFKMYFWGTSPYPKPSQKSIMSGADYLWCCGNFTSSLQLYQNAAVRTLQPITSRYMTVDLTSSQYSLAISFFDSSKTYVARHSYSSGNRYEDILSGHDNYAYYCLTLYDKPSLIQARADSFEISFTPAWQNPVLRNNLPDPTVWDGEDGYFYLFATGNLATSVMWRSRNLYEWENVGSAPYNMEQAQLVAQAFGAADAAEQSFWAPQVYKINSNTWNLYLSKPSGGIAILTSNNPTSGYTYSRYYAKPAGSNEFIDAEVARDTDDSLWMFTGGSGSIYRRQMTTDGLDWAAGSSFERCAGLAAGASGNVDRGKTFEGPYLHRRNGYWYLFCSSGMYATTNYNVRVLRSTSLSGAFLDASGNPGLDGYAETALQSGPTLWGPGHNAPIFTDTLGKDWIIYHSHWSSVGSGLRYVCLDKVEWDANGWPLINNGTPSIISTEFPEF